MNEKPPEGGLPTSRGQARQAEDYTDAVVRTATVAAVVRLPIPVMAGDPVGFFERAMSGKVRPAPREPSVTHYGCDCCRWTA